jgi:hypothetical protein
VILLMMHNDNDEPRGKLRQTKRVYVSPRRLHCLVGPSLMRKPIRVESRSDHQKIHHEALLTRASEK